MEPDEGQSILDRPAEHRLHHCLMQFQHGREGAGIERRLGDPGGVLENAFQRGRERRAIGVVQSGKRHPGRGHLAYLFGLWIDASRENRWGFPGSP